MSEEDPKIILSPKSCTVVSGDIKVEVHIFRLEDSDEWTLELIDEDDSSIVWNDIFPSDEAAWLAFEEDIRVLGLEKLLAAEEASVH